MTDPAGALAAVSRAFGPQARDAKLTALRALVDAPLPRGRALGELAATLDFLRAYPDDAEVLRAVEQVTVRLPAERRVVHPFSYEVVQRLVELHPGALDIAWDDYDDDVALQEALALLVNPVDQQGLDDQELSLQEWFAAVRPEGHTDLEFFLDLLAGSELRAEAREFLFTRAALPIQFRGPAPLRQRWRAERIEFQPAPIPRDRAPIEPKLALPLPRAARAGQRVIDLSLVALAVRKLEIYPLIHASPRDVRVFALERGIRITVAGVRPERRSALESLWFFLVAKNEVPIAYGPAGIFCGVCEMGINVYPEFRGAEIRLVDTLLMQVLHQAYAAQYFRLVPYAFGKENDDAIATGAFWFYRKLGFVPTNPKVDALARAEEARMAAEPGYRSDRRMLHRLSDTEGKLDLSSGRCTPFPFGRLGVAHSAWLAREFGGDRTRAAKQCAARVGKLLRLRPSPALGRLAPLLAQIPDLAHWPQRELQLLARIVTAKGATSESGAEPLFQRHSRLESALRALAEPVHPVSETPAVTWREKTRAN